MILKSKKEANVWGNLYEKIRPSTIFPAEEKERRVASIVCRYREGFGISATTKCATIFKLVEQQRSTAKTFNLVA